MRPLYHFTATSNWLSDPNGLVHDGALWHMFYQYNPHGEDWGHMAWGHATSPDLAHWREHEPALVEDYAGMVFSGSAVIDGDNSAGFGIGAMVAIYTVASPGVDGRQSQALAFSTDKGTTWTRYAGNPVLTHDDKDFRDPSVFWHKASHRWVMAVALSEANAVLLFVSDNLRNWRQTCRIDAGDAPGRLWECPALVELPVAGTGSTRWLLKVDALHGAPGSGALYRTGQFDGETFIPDDSGWQTIDLGSDFYAAIPFNGPRDAEGRVCWIGWMGNHAYQHALPKRGWRGVMSLPRRLELVDRCGAMVIAQHIEPAVMDLFETAAPVAAPVMQIPITCRLDISFSFVGSTRIDLGEGRFLALDWAADHIDVARQDTDLPFLACRRHLPRPVGQDVSIYLDTETCELLSADGTLAASFQHRPDASGIMLVASCCEGLSVAALHQDTAV